MALPERDRGTRHKMSIIPGWLQVGWVRIEINGIFLRKPKQFKYIRNCISIKSDFFSVFSLSGNYFSSLFFFAENIFMSAARKKKIHTHFLMQLLENKSFAPYSKHQWCCSEFTSAHVFKKLYWGNSQKVNNRESGVKMESGLNHTSHWPVYLAVLCYVTLLFILPF